MPQHAIYNKEEIRTQVYKHVNSNGSTLGPAIEARSHFDFYFDHAVAEDYRFDDPEVKRHFAHLLLAVATKGFKGKDTTGTQMGNFQGHWRGGGFSE